MRYSGWGLEHYGVHDAKAAMAFSSPWVYQIQIGRIPSCRGGLRVNYN